MRGDSAITEFLTIRKVTGRINTSNSIANYAVVFIIGGGALSCGFDGADEDNFGLNCFKIFRVGDIVDYVVEGNSTGLRSLISRYVVRGWVGCFGGVVGISDGERVKRGYIQVSSKFDRLRRSVMSET